jgi:hypothetical protein
MNEKKKHFSNYHDIIFDFRTFGHFQMKNSDIEPYTTTAEPSPSTVVARGRGVRTTTVAAPSCGPPQSSHMLEVLHPVPETEKGVCPDSDDDEDAPDLTYEEYVEYEKEIEEENIWSRTVSGTRNTIDYDDVPPIMNPDGSKVQHDGNLDSYRGMQWDMNGIYSAPP